MMRNKKTTVQSIFFVIIERVIGFFSDSQLWAKGKNPWFRLLYFVFIYFWIQHLLKLNYRIPLLWGLNLGIHELGHFIFMPFGEFLMFLGGSLTQCLVPVISMIMFYRQRDFFAIGVAFAWLSTNLYEVACYAGDAKVMELPLVSPFGIDVKHDWNWLLSYLNILDKELALESLLRYLGALTMIFSLAYCSWLIYHMFIDMRERSS